MINFIKSNKEFSYSIDLNTSFQLNLLKFTKDKSHEPVCLHRQVHEFLFIDYSFIRGKFMNSAKAISVFFQSKKQPKRKIRSKSQRKTLNYLF